MSENEVNEKVSLLRDGQIVEIDNMWFGAHPLDEENHYLPCECCGELCDDNDDVGEVCLHLNLSTECDWYLVQYPNVLG